MNRGARVLVVDNNQEFRVIIKEYLDGAGYVATFIASGAEALLELERSRIDLVLSGTELPAMDGVTLLQKVRSRFPRLPVVLTTTHEGIDRTVSAMKEGVCDYVQLPPKREELLVVMERLLELAHMRVNYDRMIDSERNKFSFQNITSISASMGETLAAAQHVAASPQATVSLYGESGVGKEVMARAIHIASGQNMTTFMAVNCAAIHESLLESELFGHVNGTLTGADLTREGKCSHAKGGTLFLDEIGDMPLSLQSKLLQLIQTGIYEIAGSGHPVIKDFRIIAASQRNLAVCCAEGNFLRELFDLLNIFTITIPPLRERREDIPLLADLFLNSFRKHQGKPLPGISKAALDLMMTHDWPGNVRELRNLLEYATIVTNDDQILPEHIRMQQQDRFMQDVPADDKFFLDLNFTCTKKSLRNVGRMLAGWFLK